MSRLICLSFTISIIFGIVYLGCKEEPTQPYDQNPNVYEGSGEIGPAGGTVRISDQNSEIFGAFVEIPEGAF